MAKAVLFCEGYFKILSASFEIKFSEKFYLCAAAWCRPDLRLRPSASLKNHSGFIGQQGRSKRNFLWHGNSKVLLEMHGCYSPCSVTM